MPAIAIDFEVGSVDKVAEEKGHLWLGLDCPAWK